MDEEGNPEAADPNELKIDNEDEDTEFVVDEPILIESKYQPR